MAENAGIYKIEAIKKRWVTYRVLADVLLCLTLALASGGLLHYFFGISLMVSAGIFVVCLGIAAILRKMWAIKTAQVTNLLDQSYPELEESSSLALRTVTGLNLLESLQLRKVENALQTVPNSPPALSDALKKPALYLIGALILFIALAYLPSAWRSGNHWNTTSSGSSVKNAPPEKVLPEIKSAEIKITPPAYTGRSSRSQDRFTIDAEDGATAAWSITTNINVKNVSLIFNEHETVVMRHGTDRQHWSAAKLLNSASFYQISIDGKLSDLYSINIIKDAPPVIHIKTPKQYTHIEAGQQPVISIAVTVNDDYGITNTVIGATVAQGSGEAVKFKEYKLNFDESFGSNGREYSLKKTIDLSKLGMTPGDELYFFIQAMDTHKQISKTDVYIVSIQDTAALLSMDGIVSGVNLKPEFFRSERQIIIDSQKLLHDRDSISKAEFNKRSNELATDQKLLRLRYGKFLGEEDESSIGEEAGSNLGKAENFSDQSKIMDAYTDKHDNAEDATFLEPTAKAQLKATLSEMWKAELQLRLYKPQDALPFEFKALTLLKDLQQKSRSYVAKTGYKTTPLKLEKRLTGDLTKIAQPVAHEDTQKQPDNSSGLQKAVVILEQLKTDPILTSADKHTLQIAARQLSLKAGSEPRVFLPAITAFKKILAGNISQANIAHAEKGIQRLLPQHQEMPTSSSTSDFGLSQGYFKNLSRLNR